MPDATIVQDCARTWAFFNFPSFVLDVFPHPGITSSP
jgi:hypothetical protein